MSNSREVGSHPVLDMSIMRNFTWGIARLARRMETPGQTWASLSRHSCNFQSNASKGTLQKIDFRPGSHAVDELQGAFLLPDTLTP